MNILHEMPTIKEYIDLRRSTGKSAQDESLAQIALNHTIHSVIVKEGDESEVLGLGRIIGDGAYFFQIVDMMASPLQKDKGIDDIVLKELLSYLEGKSLKGTHVTVMADVSSIKLYQKFGFNLVYPDFYGMSRSL
ncbi:GNAT family N-acetyltransferase [Bacillus gaemokensis]|uniref:N-acetyltransferase domain-containing protein n=1 Tax=Bacillus gaemokensis TaxID=574375 RepID=A0A073K868_9BACI|nr:GNAT family N-acetyltransferase [Bacillus gaemokensis]KEK23464.1 hypothetical protein BAGA_08150 [Bacillus gaemokensis]KYG27168.1 hypothetical protein AZF08_15555 [Bacillus gaemokensis]